MNEDHSPFYLAVNNNLKAESLEMKEWLKVGPVGINKLSHSGRKTMIQTLSENDIPPTHIAQLSGHKNLKGIENYRKVLTKKADANVQSS